MVLAQGSGRSSKSEPQGPYGGGIMKVAIIGSGLSGLTAGASLAQAGHQVTVLEQYHRAGGVTAPFDGFCIHRPSGRGL